MLAHQYREATIGFWQTAVGIESVYVETLSILVGDFHPVVGFESSQVRYESGLDHCYCIGCTAGPKLSGIGSRSNQIAVIEGLSCPC